VDRVAWALDQPVQIIDSRDLARLVVQLLTDDRPQAVHAVGPAEPVTMAGVNPDVRAGGGDAGRGGAGRVDRRYARARAARAEMYGGLPDLL
jgi:hypothetical protein